jgi:formylmethanofuran dehydrogenase subunit E
VHSEKQELASAIKDAEKLHGHLGAFLVIGVRMGQIAKKTLNQDAKKNDKLHAMAEIPLFPPFSCVLDGIQSSTQCTIGNQRLKVKKSQKEIAVSFKLKNSNRALKVYANQEVIESLMNKISKGFSNEELAREIVLMPETQLFKIEKQ